MGLLDVLSGKKPLFKSCKPTSSLESRLSVLLNSQSAHNQQYIPAPSANTERYNESAAMRKPASVSGRYTLNTSTRTKILDTDGAQWDVFITVPGVGTTAYASHDAIRILNSSGGLHEGIPLTPNPNSLGVIGPNVLKWRGEM